MTTPPQPPRPPESPPAEALSDPHNAFFAFAFGHKRHAAGLLRAVLPPALTRRLRWSTLSRRSVSFVDANLRWLHSDLLYSVRARDTGEEILIYTLIEHQSAPHALMPHRVLRYTVRIWDDHLKTHPTAQRIPLVVPVVLYHGRDPWNVARTLRDLLDAPAPLVATVAPHIPQCGYVLIDLRRKNADALLDDALTAFGRVAMWAMEVAGDDAHVLDGLRRLSDVLGEMLAQPDGHAALGALLRYLLATHETIDPTDFERAVVDALDKQAGDSVVTMYEQLIQQGMAKGLAQGLAKGRTEGRAEGIAAGRAGLLNEQLTAKFGPLPPAVRSRIETATETELTTWGVRLLTAATLAEVLGSEAPTRRPRHGAPSGGAAPKSRRVRAAQGAVARDAKSAKRSSRS